MNGRTRHNRKVYNNTALRKKNELQKDFCPIFPSSSSLEIIPRGERDSAGVCLVCAFIVVVMLSLSGSKIAAVYSSSLSRTQTEGDNNNMIRFPSPVCAHIGRRYLTLFTLCLDTQKVVENRAAGAYSSRYALMSSSSLFICWSSMHAEFLLITSFSRIHSFLIYV